MAKRFPARARTVCSKRVKEAWNMALWHACMRVAQFHLNNLFLSPPLCSAAAFFRLPEATLLPYSE